MRIKDLWKTKTGKHTARYGKGKRWLAVYQDHNGEQSKTFSSKDEAQAFLINTEHKKRSGTYIAQDVTTTMNNYWPDFMISKNKYVTLNQKNIHNALEQLHKRRMEQRSTPKY